MSNSTAMRTPRLVLLVYSSDICRRMSQLVTLSILAEGNPGSIMVAIENYRALQAAAAAAVSFYLVK